jgi:hypothetical protein
MPQGAGGRDPAVDRRVGVTEQGRGQTLILTGNPLKLTNSILAPGNHPPQAHSDRRIGRNAQGIPIHQIENAGD